MHDDIVGGIMGGGNTSRENSSDINYAYLMILVQSLGRLVNLCVVRCDIPVT